jgi:hypothetical protein
MSIHCFVAESFSFQGKIKLAILQLTPHKERNVVRLGLETKGNFDMR